uniref:Uncharacterized protein n=1 Tax=Nelumbo nucifera TaxID=4432 RepID=A0A822Y3E4_NELNU|nr:TPA_asm: hypothetical protein HUJ06_025611 [Nelumbo nucifera]
MVVLLLKFTCWVLNTLSNLVCFFIFNLSARLLVLVIQGLTVPAEGIISMLGYVGDFTKALVEYLLELLMAVLKTIVSVALDTMKETVSGIVIGAISGVGGLGNQVKDRANSLPEIIDSLAEMVQTILKDLWNNYKNAVVYVWDNA